MQSYLNEHLFRSFSHKSTINVRQTTLRPRQLRRRMSCKGAIKKTRSINADSKLIKSFVFFLNIYSEKETQQVKYFSGDTLGMEGNVIERRTSSVQSWSDARQSTLPSTSTSTAVPTYSNIFVTPPGDTENRTITDETAANKIQIKDKHDGN